MKKFLFLSFFVFQFVVWGQNYAFEDEVIITNNIVKKGSKPFTGILFSNDSGIPNKCECTLKAHYKNGVLYGVKQTWYENGKPKFKGRFIQGKPVGKHFYYYSNGIKKKEEIYENGNIIVSHVYNKDGSPKGNITSQTVGVSNSVLTKNANNKQVVAGNKSGLEQSQNNTKNGLKTIYKADGSIQEVLLYKNGLLVKDTLFYKDKLPQLIKKYADGELIHEEKYHANGNLIQEKNFLNNKKHGIQKTFFDNGHLKKLEVFEYDLPVHIEVYNEKDQLIKEENYKFGKKDGFQKFYDEKANPIEIAKYANGSLIEKEKILIDGKEIIKTRGSLIEIVELDKTGKIRAKSYKNILTGKKDSISRIYDPENGQIKSEILYKNGKTIREGSYLNGKQHGKWHFFYADGTGEKTVFYNNGKVIKTDEVIYAKQLKNIYKPNDVIFTQKQYYPKEHDEFIILRIPPTSGQELTFIKNKIQQTFVKKFKRIQLSEDLKNEQINAIIEIDSIKNKLKEKDGKYLYLIQLTIKKRNLKNKNLTYNWLVFPKKEGKSYSQMFVRNKKEAFFTTLNYLDNKIKIFLNEQFPFRVTVKKKMVSGDVVKKVYVNAGLTQGLQHKMLFELDQKNTGEKVRIKLNNPNTNFTQADVISGGKQLFQLFEKQKKLPFKLVKP